MRRVGRPVGQGYYVALTGKGETRLGEGLDAALEKLIADGRLKKLYDRWDLSGESQMLMLGDFQHDVKAATRESFSEILRNDLGLLVEAAGMTVLLSVTAMPLAILIGMLVAVGRMYGPWIVAKPLGLYVEILRGTPLMLQLYAIFFLLPKIGLLIPALVAAIAGLAINYSAYEAENLSSRFASDSARPNGSGAFAGDEPDDGCETDFVAAGVSDCHPAGDERFHRAVQRHVRLLGGDGRRADEALFDSGAQHRRDRGTGDDHGAALYAYELSALAVCSLERTPTGGRAARRSVIEGQQCKA